MLDRDEILRNFEGGSIPRSDVWQSLINTLFDTGDKAAQVESWHNAVNSIYQQIEQHKAVIDQQHNDVEIWHKAVEGWHSHINEQAAIVDQKTADATESAKAAEAAKLTAEQAAQSCQSTLDRVVETGEEQTAKVTSEGDRQVKNLTTISDTEKQELIKEGNNQKTALANASNVHQTALENEADQQRERVIAEGSRQINRVEAESADHISNVENAGTEQVGRMQSAGLAQIREIEKAGDQQSDRLNNEASIHVNSAKESADKAEAAADDATQDAQNSREHADRAKESADKASASEKVATTKANEAKQSANNAASVVTGGTATIVPSDGKIPLADSKGAIDSNWIPLIQAMYPHSGVIGSVDKNDIFKFQGAFSNLGYIKGDVAFNIAGRLVRFPTVDTKIVFQEAESTPDRAIAFDDIFLDWDGNVTPYRSITPHRTTTGYDADAIATEHGYTKVSTGLYKIGDTYDLLLGRVARRNKGAYHPVFNSEGSRQLRTSNDDGAVEWWKSNAGKPSSIAQCFLSFADGGFNAGNGNISSAYTGRPGSDNKFYDAIYEDDFTPLYYSAKNVIDRQALLFDSFNKAVSGETFSGAEGIYILVNAHSSDFSTREESISVTDKSITFTKTVSYGVALFNIDVRPNTLIEVEFDVEQFAGSISFDLYDPAQRIIDVPSNGHYSARYVTPYGGDRLMFICRSNGTSATITNVSVKVHNAQAASARPQFLMCDIIGSLDAMPDEWKTHGIPGNWLAVGEEGESLIPDGTQKNYKLSRKCLECYQVLYTEDGGTTWSDITSGEKSSFEGSENSTKKSWPATHCVMVFYRTSANPFELTINAVVSAFLGTLSAIVSNNTSEICSNILGKIPTYAGNPSYNGTFVLQSGYPAILSPHNPPQLYGANQATPKHSPVLTGGGHKVACKLLPYLSGSYMRICYKELKHNGEQWGDDNKFDIIDYQSTVTDLNGEQVIVGQKRVELPYHFTDGDKY